MNLEVLYDILDQENPDTVRYRVADHLSQAINDWPEKINSIGDYTQKLKKMLNSDTVNTFVIDEFRKDLKPEKDAWLIESITNLKTVFEISGHDDINLIEKSLLEA